MTVHDEVHPTVTFNVDMVVVVQASDVNILKLYDAFDSGALLWNNRLESYPIGYNQT